MKKALLKFLAAASAGIMLISGLSTFTPVQTKAVSVRTMSKYARKYHRVVVVKPTWVYRVKLANPRVNNRYYKAYKLKPGDSVLIKYRGIEWDWTIGKSGHYCSFRSSFSWFEPYSKYTWVDTALLDNSFKEKNLCYRFNWKQYRKIISLGVLSNSYKTSTWKHKVRPLIKKWHLKLEKIE